MRQLINRKVVIALSLLLIFMFTISACGKEDEEVKETEISVSVDAAVERDIAETMTYSGMVRGKNEVQIMPKAAARVTSIHVKPGDSVRAGQLVLSLDNSDFQASVRQAEAGVQQAQAGLEQATAGWENAQVGLVAAESNYNANKINLDNSRNNYERTKTLYEAGAASLTQLEQAKMQVDLYELQANENGLNQARAGVNQARAGVKQAEAAIAAAQAGVDQARKQLDNCQLTAPINGVVGSINLSLGETSNPGMPAAVISDMRELELEVYVSEAEVSHISEGSVVALSISAAQDAIFNGRVQSVATVADSMKQNFLVKIGIDNSAGLIKSGMFAEVRIPATERKNVLTVPINAVIPRDGKNIVYLLDEENRAKEIEVDTGISSVDYIEVKSGLSAGDKVVFRGNTLLIDGTLLRVVKSEG